jgi:hypothetical protein
MMQKPRRLIILGLLATVVMSGVFLSTAFAQEAPTTDAQIDRIRTNCATVKNTLTQLHVSDALLRVNRGQLYESITTKLMSSFNGRASSNNLDATGLVVITSSYNGTLSTFRADYQSYEQQLSAALKIDCTKEPVAFYDAVANARDKRAQVHNDVLVLNQSIDDYQTAFNSFADSFAATSSVGNLQ